MWLKVDFEKEKYRIVIIKKIIINVE